MDEQLKKALKLVKDCKIKNINRRNKFEALTVIFLILSVGFMCAKCYGDGIIVDQNSTIKLLNKVIQEMQK